MKKQASPVISIIMPLHNQARWVSSAIESILDQTFKDFELIVIDDASKDDSANIVSSYAEKDSRVLLVRNKSNRKIVRTLNKGIKRARGQYIARQDSDDISHPQRLEAQMLFFNENPEIVFTGTWYAVIDDNNTMRGDVKPPSDPSEIRELMKTMNPFGHGTVMFRRSIIEKAGLYDPGYRQAEDYEYWTRIQEHYPLLMANIPVVLYAYRVHDDQRSSKGFNEMMQATGLIADLARKRL